jgi:hypothetical protein
LGKIFENLFKKPLTQKSSNLLQGDLMQSHGQGVAGATVKKSNFACVYMGNINQYDSGERCGPWASYLKIGLM